jgi:hypothetical protein
VKRKYAREDFNLSLPFVSELNRRILTICPTSETGARAPRSTSELSHWKASEFRSALLFYFPSVLQEPFQGTTLVIPAVLRLIMLLSNSLFLSLQVPVPEHHIPIIDRLLRRFVTDYQRVFGLSAMTYNVHKLCHIPQSIAHDGSLETISTFFLVQQPEAYFFVQKSSPSFDPNFPPCVPSPRYKLCRLTLSLVELLANRHPS